MSSYLLRTHTIYRKTANRLTNRVRWANHNMNIILGKEAPNMGDKWCKFEERALMVKTQNSYAQALNKIILEEGAKLEELKDRASRIQAMARALSSLQYAKRGKP